MAEPELVMDINHHFTVLQDSLVGIDMLAIDTFVMGTGQVVIEGRVMVIVGEAIEAAIVVDENGFKMKIIKRVSV